MAEEQVRRSPHRVTDQMLSAGVEGRSEEARQPGHPPRGDGHDRDQKHRDHEGGDRPPASVSPRWNSEITVAVGHALRSPATPRRVPRVVAQDRAAASVDRSRAAKVKASDCPRNSPTVTGQKWSTVTEQKMARTGRSHPVTCLDWLATKRATPATRAASSRAVHAFQSEESVAWLTGARTRASVGG